MVGLPVLLHLPLEVGMDPGGEEGRELRSRTGGKRHYQSMSGAGKSKRKEESRIRTETGKNGGRRQE